MLMSAVETRQMSAAETRQRPAVETRQMSTIGTGQSHLAKTNLGWAGKFQYANLAS